MNDAATRSTLVLLGLLSAWALTPSQASADGLPVQGVSAGRSGVEAPGPGVRYIAVRAGQGTLVAEISLDDGRVLDSTYLNGRFTIPAVAYDATASGLSADGRTLVLIRPRRAFPQARTTFAALDAERLALEEVKTIEGDFSFDALSPEGRTLYLIEYPSENIQRYRVRAYDLREDRLAPDPIVDPTEPDERMAGMPMSRAMSPDGRWAYTLYEGAGGHEPFIHALDTQRGTAACIDLPQLEDRPGYKLDLGVASATGLITVDFKKEPAVTVNPDGFDVSEVSAAGEGEGTSQSGEGLPWTIPVAAIACVVAIAVLARRRRRNRPVSEAELAELVEIELPAERDRQREDEGAPV